MNESFYVVEAQVACTLSANTIRIYGLDSDPVYVLPLPTRCWETRNHDSLCDVVASD
jgi:hypothetical protein